MTTLGLTGGIGMGKSTCGQLLRSRSIPVVDTDDLARQVVEPGQPALDEIRSTFGYCEWNQAATVNMDEDGQ